MDDPGRKPRDFPRQHRPGRGIGDVKPEFPGGPPSLLALLFRLLHGPPGSAMAIAVAYAGIGGAKASHLRSIDHELLLARFHLLNIEL